MNTLSHLRYFCDEFYKFYAHSSKRMVELETCAKELSTELLKIGKVFDVRWLMSSYNAVNALWKDLPSLQLHMEKLTHVASGEARKHKAKYRGLCQKLKKWTVVAEMALLRDALSKLALFSLHLQHR